MSGPFACEYINKALEEMKIAVRNSRIHVHAFGKGADLLIAFHGFSESGAQYAPVGRALQDRFTTFAIDLPFHGLSQWQESRYRPEDLLYVIDELMHYTGHRTYYLCGYSLGARVALSLYQRRPDKVEGIILLAPDGIRTRWLSTLQRIPKFAKKRVGHWVLRNPNGMPALAKQLHKWKWIDRYAHDFIHRHFADEEKRHRSIYNWQSMDFFRFRAMQVAWLIRRRSTPTFIYYGIKDPLIDAQAVAAFANRCDAQAVALPLGHYIISDPLISQLRQDFTR